MKEELTAELYSSWRQHPVTQAIFGLMAQQVEDSKESWLSGHFTNEANFEATVLMQAREQERARIYQALISQTADQFLQSVGGE